MTLRSRLTAAFVLVVLAPLLLVVVLVTTVLPSTLAARQQEGLLATGRVAAVVVDQLCRRARATAETAGRASSDPSTLAAALDGLVRNELADGVLVQDPAGAVLGQAGAVPVPQEGADCTTGALLRRADGTAQVAAAVRLQRPGGQAGSAVAGFDVDRALLESLHGRDGEVVLLAGGQVVASSGTVPDQLVRDAQRAAGTPVRQGTRLAVVLAERPYQPLAVLLAAPAVEGVVLLPYAVGLLLAAVALAAGIALLLARATTRPLEELGDAAARVAGGDLSTTIEVRSRDEVGRLATAFNTMTEELRTYLGALQDSRDELQAGVARLGDTLSGTHDLERILSVVLDAAMASTRARAGAVLLLVEDRSALEVVVGRGLAERGVPDDLLLPVGTGVAGSVVRSGEAVRGRVGALPGGLQTAWGRLSGETLVAVPLTRAGTAIGVLVLLDRADGAEFDDRDLATLRTFTSQATVAVDNVILHQEARRLSITDELTGLWNRRYFRLTVDKEIERAARFHRPLALLVVDLDHFSEVNNVHGHLRGDAVLVELAQRVRAEVRDVDTAARYGGDELVAVLPETDEQGACQVAERIRAAVSACPFAAPGQPSVALSVSIGVAVFPGHGADATSLLGAADEALFVAKRAGRDAWRLAGDPVAQGPS